MKVLLTGGAGFIGSHLAEHFNDKAEVRVLDNLRTGRRENLRGLDCEFIEGSILDDASLRQAMKGIDLVFHLAAMVSVSESMQDPLACEETNTKGTLMVLRAAADAGVKKLCFSSSSAVYGDNPASPKTEDMPPAPGSPYAVSKLAGEHYAAMFAAQGWLETAAMRYFNVFGPRQDPDSPYAAAIPGFIGRALGQRELAVYGDGEQTRDFVFVAEVVAANVHLAEGPHRGVFNVAYGNAMTINELAREIVAQTGSASAIVHQPARAGDIKHSRASIGKLLATGFEPCGSLPAGLGETIAWYAEQLR